MSYSCSPSMTEEEYKAFKKERLNSRIEKIKVIFPNSKITPYIDYNDNRFYVILDSIHTKNVYFNYEGEISFIE